MSNKIVTLSFDFVSGVANGETAYFAKFVPAANTSTTFTFIAPLPEDFTGNSIAIGDIIHLATLEAEYYFVG